MTTTLRKVIESIDFNNKQLESSPDLNGLANLFNIYNFTWTDDTQLKAYFIKVHYCTDTYVGIRAYFLNGEFVALSNQIGRKYNEDFGFVNKECAEKVKKYILSLIEEDDNSEYDILEDLDEEIPNTYTIEYNTQIIHKYAIYEGKKVEIIKTNFEKEGINSPNYFHSVIIKINNEEKLVNCKDLDFEFNTLT